MIWITLTAVPDTCWVWTAHCGTDLCAVALHASSESIHASSDQRNIHQTALLHFDFGRWGRCLKEESERIAENQNQRHGSDAAVLRHCTNWQWKESILLDAKWEKKCGRKKAIICCQMQQNTKWTKYSVYQILFRLLIVLTNYHVQHVVWYAYIISK